MCDSPEESDYTSIQERLGLSREAGEAKVANSVCDGAVQLRSELLPFAGSDHIHNNPKHLPFSLLEYFELVDWTGRQIREDKRGVISARMPPILQRLDIQIEQWLIASTGIEQHFSRAIGNQENIHQYQQNHGIRWLHHQQDCQQLYQN
jgi:hypothetical protein